MDIGNIILERRKFLNIRQEDLAELCDISMKTIQKIEKNRANPTLNTLHRILEVLGMEVKINIKGNEGNYIL